MTPGSLRFDTYDSTENFVTVSRSERDAREVEDEGEPVHIFTDAAWTSAEACLAGVAFNANQQILTVMSVILCCL